MILCKLRMCYHQLIRNLDQFLLKNYSVISDNDNNDFEFSELYDLLKTVNQKKNERKDRGVITNNYYELTNGEMYDILVIARKIRDERL